MPPKASEFCRVTGCQSPRHIYPSGAKCQFCREHMKYRNAKQRQGRSSMTGQMRDVLHYLRQVKADGRIFVELQYPFAHGKTLNGLFDREWIFRSETADNVMYKITFRGEDALAFFESTEQPRDGLCPRCRKQPRHVRSSGVQDAYCLDCLRLPDLRAASESGSTDRSS